LEKLNLLLGASKMSKSTTGGTTGQPTGTPKPDATPKPDEAPKPDETSKPEEKPADAEDKESQDAMAKVAVANRDYGEALKQW
jgi:outer membrane biosynthesis protein TonB